MIHFEDLKLARFRAAWDARCLVRVPPPNMPVWMVEAWRSVKDDYESFTTIDDEERDDFDEWVPE